FATVVIKATFCLPDARVAAPVAAEQRALLTQDVPYDPDKLDGLLKFESDLAPFKPRADIVLVGSAYPSRGKRAAALDVVIRVGRTEQVIRVVGDRRWSLGSDSSQPGMVGPLEFEAMPLRYERAFGGWDEPELVHSPLNPFGRGLIAQKTVRSVHGKELPNLENPAEMIGGWDARPLPTGCGFYPRAGLPRRKYLGTYDEVWRKARCPLPPADFRFDFYNGAHPNLQVEGYLRGNEEVLLRHVRRGSEPLRFFLPCLRPKVHVERTAGQRAEPLFAPLDTLVFVPDEGVFYQVWRARIPCREPDASDLRRVTIEYERMAPEQRAD
ncbi:MAG TPA: DUF2169 domain-containing protein, partial [Polyangiaceae bacterium]|nr:DUF2169 domain-containing protein [Polyangiaceae bacterium]